MKKKNNEGPSEFNSSRHSRKRMQQRGITKQRIQLIIDYGRCRPRKGGLVFFMDKQSRRVARRDQAEKYRANVDKLDCYVVVSLDGVFITAGHRMQRFKWN